MGWEVSHLYWHRGEGVTRDYAKALKWYRKAAEQGNADAQYSLGLMYSCGTGVPKNYTKAAEWFRKAAVQGSGDAQWFLGALLEKTDYPGWKYLSRTDTEYLLINKNKVRRQGNLV